MTTEVKNCAAIPEGETLGILYSVVDLGDRERTYEGKTKSKPIVRLEFETPGHMKEGGYVATAKVKLPVYSYSLGAIAKYFQALGIEVNDTMKVGDMIALLGEKIGTAVRLDIGIKDGNTPEGETIRFNFINDIKANEEKEGLPGMFNTKVYFNQAKHNDSEADVLPEFVKKEINFSSAKVNTVEEDENDLPFK